MDKVRASRDGQEFHKAWTARKAMQLLWSDSKLVAIAVEGLSPSDQSSASAETVDIADKAELYLSVLDSAETMKELDIVGFGLHPLKGNRRGFYSVFVSRNHRIIFRFADGKAFDVDLVDYH